MVRPKMFPADISNCTNLFRQELNQTRHRIFAFVRLLFSNLDGFSHRWFAFIQSLMPAMHTERQATMAAASLAGILTYTWQCETAPQCTKPTQPSISPGSVNEYQLQLGRQRQVWFIPLQRTWTADTASPASLLLADVVCLTCIVDGDHQRSSAGLVLP